MTSQITAIIPAVDEPDIDRTIRSLLDQSSVPDRIIVAVNNTSSSVTHQAAARVQDERVEVVDLGSIKGKKAGALNAALALVSTPLVMVVDADTVVSPDFVRQALETLRTPDIGAVGGIFFGQSPRGWLQWCQAMEYARYGQQVEESRRVMVLTGTAAIIRLQALNDVHQARLRGDLPGHGVYDISAITEKGRKMKTNEERFWSKVDKSGDAGCWLWKGRTNEDGYGGFDVAARPHNKSVLSHRYSYELANGPITESAYILHSCNTPACVNPAHLREGDQSENMADRRKAGRDPDRRGENQGRRAKLTWEAVRHIRSTYTGAYGETARLAREYGVSKTVMGKVVSGEGWREEVVPSVSAPSYYDVNAITED